MNENTSNLERKIVEKNMLINSFDKHDDSQQTKIQDVEMELDGLLYQYYKMLGNKKD
ncbi:hypothetical protein [Acetivibrio saccincola]|jgi:hypothetical protein|uniref:Spo0E like sporulation regulatory protein n=2 Tax=Acetivibrio saccincola TaxID=1677857 RepID=A0A2K9E5R1_9FIRM|nr:hypothetical protein [Acetivibrio saccincola]AUG58699.1 hypothetical protein HVS_14190 [Acetivibrio saccincola]HQD29013.1 hypothetical protein [Acetivibrio saccincola]